jgi:hypothetical protein
LGTDDIGALDRVATEEDYFEEEESVVSIVSSGKMLQRLTWPVQSDDVVVSLSSVKLDGKATRVASGVRELTADGDSGESNEERSLAADCAEQVCLKRCQTYLGIELSSV